MRTSILVPFKGDGGQRDRLWDHCRALWDALPYEVCVGHDDSDGPFNISRAFNDARSMATGDKFVIYGADQLPDRARIEWAIEVLDTQAWIGIFAQTGHYDHEATEAILAGANPDTLPVSAVTPFCIAIIAIRADCWVPFDERFQGWGSEDTAWRTALESLYGPPRQASGTLRCLHHEPAPRDNAEANYALLREYQHARDAGTMREYLASTGVTNGRDP